MIIEIVVPYDSGLIPGIMRRVAFEDEALEISESRKTFGNCLKIAVQPDSEALEAFDSEGRHHMKGPVDRGVGRVIKVRIADKPNGEPSDGGGEMGRLLRPYGRSKAFQLVNGELGLCERSIEAYIIPSLADQ